MKKWGVSSLFLVFSLSIHHFFLLLPRASLKKRTLHDILFAINVMKKEFGKWFLDLAKYILTAVFLTTYLTEIEGTALIWLSMIFFFGSLFIGYSLLKSADKELMLSSNTEKDDTHEIKAKNKKQPKKNKK